MFQYIFPLFRENYYSPCFRQIQLLFTYFTCISFPPYFDHDAFRLYITQCTYWTPLLGTKKSPGIRDGEETFMLCSPSPHFLATQLAESLLTIRLLSKPSRTKTQRTIEREFVQGAFAFCPDFLY